MSGDLPFTLRPVMDADRQRLFDWRNDPAIQAISVNDRPVTWAEHTAWFARQTDSERHLLLMVDLQAAGTVGWVRFDRQGEHATVSILLRPNHTGRGLGVAILQEGAKAAFSNWPIKRLVAQILQTNERSLSAFAKAGFGSAPDVNQGDFTGMALARPR